jgi:hypothetical protein
VDADMSDRSLQAGEIRQSVVVTGDGNNVSLRFGETGIILPLKRKQFRPPDRRRAPLPEERPRELDLLMPEAGKLPFVGRDDLFLELRAWLDQETDISVHALIGRAGSGKTRLALELCKSVDSDFSAKGPWLAGFLSPRDVPLVAEMLVTHSFAWERSTLLVIDYAAQTHSALARWLDRLAYERLTNKLRFLLLEREAPEGFGWWHELTSPSLRDQVARVDLFYALRPRQLPDLSDLEERRSLITAALQAALALRPPSPAAQAASSHGADRDFDAFLAKPQFGNPLNLVMAGLIARDRGPGAALALRHLDAARQLGRRELDRFADLGESRGLNGDTMRHIVAFNVLVNGLPIDRLAKTLADELAASHYVADIAVLSKLLEQELPPQAEADVSAKRCLATIQPDLIGEAVIIEAFSGQPSKEAKALELVRRAYALGPGAAAQVLMQLLQDFAYALEDQNATAAEKATGERIMGWLIALARGTEDPAQLLPLAWALPQQTTVLREAAAELTQEMSSFFRHVAMRSSDLATLSHVAHWEGALAVRLIHLGERENALDAAQESVRLYRALSEARPDVFTYDLAHSLNNLANSLLLCGRREDALAVAEEAVRLRRALATVQPDAVGSLAFALISFAISLSALGQHEKALAAEEEAVRDLSLLAENRDKFAPDLALALNNLANSLRRVGRFDEAVAKAEDAVRIRRALAETRPDAYMPDLAQSLSCLANILAGYSRPKEAAAFAEEAVRRYRPLAKAHEGAFEPDLAKALGIAATALSDIGQDKKAVQAGEEATELYRSLTAKRPDAFMSDLAMSLSNLANRRGAVGRTEASADAAVEALNLYITLSEAHPDAFGPDLGRAYHSAAYALDVVGRHKQALAAGTGAVRCFRALAMTQQDAFLPDLAKSLFITAKSMFELGQCENAVAAGEEARDLYRALSEGRPDVFTSDLALSLNNLANSLLLCGRREDALAVAEEAVRLRRALAAVQPDLFATDLAQSLNNYSNALGDLGRRKAAISAAEEAVNLYRAAAEKRGDSVVPELARSLGVLSELYGDGEPALALSALHEGIECLTPMFVSHPATCLAIMTWLTRSYLSKCSAPVPSLVAPVAEALQKVRTRNGIWVGGAEAAAYIYRALAKARPDAFRPELATALHNLALGLSDLGRNDEALLAAAEAISLFRDLAESGSANFAHQLASSLSNLTGMLSDCGRHEEALVAAEEAVRAYRSLEASLPGEFRPDLARALDNLSNCLFYGDRREEALVCGNEAVALFRSLAHVRPDEFTPDLALAIKNLASSLAGMGRLDEARAAMEDAVRLYRALTEQRGHVAVPDLARSLADLGGLNKEANPELALETFREGVERLLPAFVAAPAEFKALMAALAQGYISQCEALGRTPDWTLLEPVAEAFEGGTIIGGNGND